MPKSAQAGSSLRTSNGKVSHIHTNCEHHLPAEVGPGFIPNAYFQTDARNFTGDGGSPYGFNDQVTDRLSLRAAVDKPNEIDSLPIGARH